MVGGVRPDTGVGGSTTPAVHGGLPAPPSTRSRHRLPMWSTQRPPHTGPHPPTADASSAHPPSPHVCPAMTITHGAGNVRCLWRLAAWISVSGQADSTPMPAASLLRFHSAATSGWCRRRWPAPAARRPWPGPWACAANGSQSKNRHGVLPGDLVDLVVGVHLGVLELLPRELRRLRPRGVGVGVVALPGDDVDADAVAQQQAGRVGDVAGQDVLAEHLGRQLAAEVVAAVEPAPGSRSGGRSGRSRRGSSRCRPRTAPPAGRGTSRSVGPKSRSWAVMALIWQASTIRWSTGASCGRLDDLEAGADVQRQHHVLVADGLEHRVPVAGQEAREALHVRRLEEADRPAALLADAVDLLDGEVDVPHRGRCRGG